MTAHTSRNRCENPLNARSENRPEGAVVVLCRRTPGRPTGGAVGVVPEVTVLMSPSSERDAVAPVDDAQLDSGQQDREDRQRHTHRTGVAELALVERGEVDHRGEHL